MNQIKFRAWDKTGQHPCMIEVESIMYDEFDKMSISGKPFDEDNGGFTHLEEGEFELLQFTGLQDKNGADIYEGDIVSQKLNCLWDEGRHNLEVRFNHDQFQTGNVKSYSSLYSAVQSFDAEVIGNIHQNPELIK
jgi:uncharacterized phage protein (TIGR01671 family)